MSRAQKFACDTRNFRNKWFLFATQDNKFTVLKERLRF